MFQPVNDNLPTACNSAPLANLIACSHKFIMSEAPFSKPSFLTTWLRAGTCLFEPDAIPDDVHNDSATINKTINKYQEFVFILIKYVIWIFG